MLLSLPQRKRAPPAATAEPAQPPEPNNGLTRPEPAASLLATPRRQKLLKHICQRTSLSRKQFASLYLAPLGRYAELLQQFPARNRLTTPIRVACWSTAWRSSPTPSSCGSHT